MNNVLPVDKASRTLPICGVGAFSKALACVCTAVFAFTIASAADDNDLISSVLPAALFFCRLVNESDTSGITSLDTVSKAVTAVRAADKSSPTYGITVPIRHTIPSV